ncbi:MAG: hypothetical protein AB7W16_25030 [Candidatus Obscuribacterales bacterium]
MQSLKIDIIAFAVGLALALTLLSFCGKQASKTCLFRTVDFHRIHRFISPYTSFYPTISELIELVEKRSPPDKIVVVVGGDSVFNGMCQSPDKLWTDELGRLLGDRYAVTNISFHGMHPFAAGCFVSEYLLKKGRKVICLTDGQPDKFGAGFDDQHANLYYDALFKGKLMDCKEREKVLGFISDINEKAFNTQMIDLKLGKGMDSLFYACDFWNTIGYQRFFTIWTPATGPRFLLPRRLFKDEGEPPLYDQPRLERELGYLKERTRHLAVLDRDGHARLIESTYKRFDAFVPALTPDELKKKLLVFQTRFNPSLRQRLTAREASLDDEIYELTARRFARFGYQVVTVGGDFLPSDYCDANHFSDQGGVRLARVVAVQVEELARRLSY